MYSLLKMGIFHCYVSLPAGTFFLRSHFPWDSFSDLPWPMTSLLLRPIREDFTKASALREAAGPIMEWAQEIFGNVKRKVWFQTVQKKRVFWVGRRC